MVRTVKGQEEMADAESRPGDRLGALSLSKPPSHAAFNLRQFSIGRQRLGTQRALSQPLLGAPFLDTLKDRERQKRRAAYLEAWHQRDEDERGLQKAAREEAEQAANRERQRLRDARREREEQSRHKTWVAAMRRKDEREEQERLAREFERQAREAFEQKKRREEEEERQRRAPRVCELCSGTGLCVACNGTGLMVQDFLVPSTGPGSTFLYEFGRKPQGCSDCGGHSPGIGGSRMSEGSGRCAHCGGLGQVWPHLEEDEDDESPVAVRRTRSSAHGVGYRRTRSSGRSPTSSRQLSCVPTQASPRNSNQVPAVAMAPPAGGPRRSSSKASAASKVSATSLHLPTTAAARPGARSGEKAPPPAGGAPMLPAVPGAAGRGAQP